MNSLRRDLMFQIADGVQETFPILYQFDKLTLCDEVLKWCVLNKVTGNKLVNMFQEQKCSYLNLSAEILRRIYKNKEKQKIIANVDYKL